MEELWPFLRLMYVANISMIIYTIFSTSAEFKSCYLFINVTWNKSCVSDDLILNKVKWRKDKWLMILMFNTKFGDFFFLFWPKIPKCQCHVSHEKLMNQKNLFTENRSHESLSKSHQILISGGNLIPSGL